MAGKSSAMRMPMIAIETSSSTSVNARVGQRTARCGRGKILRRIDNSRNLRRNSGMKLTSREVEHCGNLRLLACAFVPVDVLQFHPGPPLRDTQGNGHINQYS